jgi:hypothetical protein
MAAFTHYESGGNRVVPSPAHRDEEAIPCERWNDCGSTGLIPDRSADMLALWGRSWIRACRDPMAPLNVSGVEESTHGQHA